MCNFADCSYTSDWRRTAECLERHTCKWLRRFFAGHLCHRKQHWHRFLCQYICFPLSVSLHIALYSVFPCQCHSTLLYILFSPFSVTPQCSIFCFPLSVSLHHCSTLTHWTACEAAHWWVVNTANADRWFGPPLLISAAVQLQPCSYPYRAIVHNSYFLNHKTAPWCNGLRLYPTGVPKDPAVVRWSAWGWRLVRRNALQ